MNCTQDHNKIMQKFCSECGEIVLKSRMCSGGHDIPAGKKFCSICGKSISTTSEINEVQDDSANQNTESIRELPTYTYNSKIAESASKQKNNTLLFIGLGVGLFILIVLLFSLFKSNRVNQDSVDVATNVSITVEMTLTTEFDCFDISSGYNDIPGAQVIISMDGVPVGFGTYSYLGSSSGLGCKFTANIFGVPTTGMNYSVEMASGRRGTIYATKTELEGRGWTFSLTLG